MGEQPDKARAFREQLRHNKGNSATVVLDERIKTMVKRILRGEISAKQAEIEYQIDRETIRRKIHQLIQEDKSLLAEYVEYLKKSGNDYSRINFRGLIIFMIRQNLSQSQIAAKYDIPARTVSRELEKIGQSDDEKDRKLYEIAKGYAKMKMRREIIAEGETLSYATTLDELFGEVEIIKIDEPSKDEKETYELEKFVAEVEQNKARGMTMKEIASAMGVSISAIRRKELKLSELKTKRNIMTGGREK